MSSSSDPFLQSMTFAVAGEHLRSCDCEECDNVPPAILAALRERKRIRLESGAVPLKRTQHRELLNRHGSVSVYNLTLPVGAEPLLEFGSSHRIVWIERLPSGSNVIQSIGTGIVGSSDEEKSRKCLEDWKEGTVILVPSNGGKAVGWIHDEDKGTVDDEAKNTEATSNSSSSGPAVLFMAKIPDKVLANGNTEQQQNDSDVEQPQWVKTLLKCCHDGLQEWNTSKDEASDTEKKEPCSYYIFPQETGKLIIQALQAAKNKEDYGNIPKTTTKKVSIPSPVNTPAPAPTEPAACSATAKGKCEPCEGLDKSALLTLDQAKTELAAMTPPGIWTIKNESSSNDGGDNVPVLHFQFTARNFQAALDAINAMGAIAEREGHHPNFHLTNYRQVSVDIYTHSLGGLTKNDFVLAGMLTTEVSIAYSPKWLRENPAAQSTSKQQNKK